MLTKASIINIIKRSNHIVAITNSKGALKYLLVKKFHPRLKSSRVKRRKVVPEAKRWHLLMIQDLANVRCKCPGGSIAEHFRFVS